MKFSNYSNINKRYSWTLDEDWLLLNHVLENRKKWSFISKQIKGRNENSVKNRWFSINKAYKSQLDKSEEIEQLIEAFKKENPEFASTQKKQKKMDPTHENDESNGNISLESEAEISKQLNKKVKSALPTKENLEIMNQQQENKKCLVTNLKKTPSEILEEEENKENSSEKTEKSRNSKSSKKLTWTPQSNESLIDGGKLKKRNSFCFEKPMTPKEKRVLLYDIRQQFRNIPNIYQNQTFEEANFNEINNLTSENKDEKNNNSINNLLVSREMKKGIDDILEDFSIKFSSLSISDQYLYEANKILNEFNMSLEKSPAPFSISRYLEKKDKILHEESDSSSESENEKNEIMQQLNPESQKNIKNPAKIRNKLHEMISLDGEKKHEEVIEFANSNKQRPSIQFSNYSSIFCDVEKKSPGGDSIMNSTFYRLCEFDDFYKETPEDLVKKFGSTKMPMRKIMRNNIKRNSIKMV